MRAITNYYTNDVLEYGSQLRLAINEEKSFEELLPILGKKGFLGTRFQSGYSQLPNVWQYQAIFAEIIGNKCSPSIAMALTIHNDMVLPMLFRFSTPEIKKVTSKAIAGECVLAHAVTEKTSGSDFRQITTTATCVKGGITISGIKCFVSNGVLANYFCTLVKIANDANYPLNLAVVLIPADTPGVSIVHHHRPWGNRQISLVDLKFDDVFVKNHYVLGSLKSGYIVQVNQFIEERVISSFRATSLAEKVLDYTIMQCKSRNLGTETVLSKQSIKHQLAKLKIDVASSYAINHAGLNAIMKNQKNLLALSCSAKWISSRLIRQVARACLQLCGASGYIQHNFAEVMLRDTRLFSISTGTDELMFDTITKNIIEPVC